MGTENLFAREFGMTSEPSPLHAALGKSNASGDSKWIGAVEHCDVGYCNDRPFALMVSVGFDAHVVERVAQSRTSSISKISYVLRGVEELLSFRTPRFTVIADGRKIVDDRAGIAIIANSRQYAARLDPARHAVINDGELDVLFIPFSTRLGLVRRLAQIFFGVHMGSSQFVHAKARTVRIESSQDAAMQPGNGAAKAGVVYQVDGELCPADERTPLELRIAPGVLPVLSPRAAAVVVGGRGKIENLPQVGERLSASV